MGSAAERTVLDAGRLIGAAAAAGRGRAAAAQDRTAGILYLTYRPAPQPPLAITGASILTGTGAEIATGNGAGARR